MLGQIDAFLVGGVFVDLLCHSENSLSPYDSILPKFLNSELVFKHEFTILC